MLNGVLDDPLSERRGLAEGYGGVSSSLLTRASGNTMFNLQTSGSTRTVYEYTPPAHRLRACP